MSVEDRLRAAGRAAAETVRDVPPLDLPDLPVSPTTAPVQRRHGGRRWTGAGQGRGWRPWLAPLAAAAAVIAVAATLVAVRSIQDRPSGAPAAPTAATTSVPRYYVALSAPSNWAKSPAQVVAGDTRTGARLATVSPPKGYTFTGVTGAADDRTFVLDAKPWPWSLSTEVALLPRTFYLLRLSPGTAQPARLTPLSIPVPSGGLLDGMALSPDGHKLAVMWQLLEARQAVLQIYSVPTPMPPESMLDSWWTAAGASAGPGAGGLAGITDSGTSLSWADGGRELTFFYAPQEFLTGVMPAPGTTIRAVNADGRAEGDLLADSRVVAVLRSVPPAGCESTLVTADGRTVICGTMTVPGENGAPGPGFAEYSTVTGQYAGFLYRYPGTASSGEASVMWAPSGGTLVGFLTVPLTVPKLGRQDVGVFTQGKFRPLPIRVPAGDLNLLEIAF
jgi:hypothetical protein